MRGDVKDEGSSIFTQIEKAPKVSVCVIAYNQEKYIRQCLQSIIDQQTDFEFDVVVGDDYSTDETPQIIQEFADRYPGRVTLILNKSKIGGTQNYVSTHLRARGEYVAHLDGDDLAYPGKLQRQADLLDQRKNLAMVWHIMKIFDDDIKSVGQTHLFLADIVDTQNVTLRDVLRFGSLGAASSIMYRRAVVSYLSEICGDTLDFYFTARILEHGDGARINDVLGGYRLNPGAVTLSKNKTPYFSPSPMRSVYAAHLATLYDRNKNFKIEIFLNSFFNLCVEIRFLRPTIAPFFLVALRTFSVAALTRIPGYLSQAFRLRAK